MSDLFEMFQSATPEDLQRVRQRIKAATDELSGLRTLEKALSSRLGCGAQPGRGGGKGGKGQRRKGKLVKDILALVGDGSEAVHFVAHKLNVEPADVRACCARNSDFLMIDGGDRVHAVPSAD